MNEPITVVVNEVGPPVTMVASFLDTPSVVITPSPAASPVVITVSEPDIADPVTIVASPVISEVLITISNGISVSAPGSQVAVFNETPIGLMNGANALFLSVFAFVPESVEVFLNGLKLKIVDEYNTNGNTQITLSVSPEATEILLINYLKI